MNMTLQVPNGPLPDNWVHGFTPVRWGDVLGQIKRGDNCLTQGAVKTVRRTGPMPFAELKRTGWYFLVRQNPGDTNNSNVKNELEARCRKYATRMKNDRRYLVTDEFGFYKVERTR